MADTRTHAKKLHDLFKVHWLIQGHAYNRNQWDLDAAQRWASLAKACRDTRHVRPSDRAEALWTVINTPLMSTWREVPEVAQKSWELLAKCDEAICSEQKETAHVDTPAA